MGDEREKGIRARLARPTLHATRWNDSDIRHVLDALAAARRRLTECEGDARQMSLRTIEYDDEIERLEAALAAAREENGRLVRHLGRIEAWAQHHKAESRSQLRGTMELVHNEAMMAREELGLAYGEMPAALAREATDADH